MGSISEKAEKLLHNQLEVWQLAQTNYRNLSTVRSKEFDFGNFKVRVQFNPGRIQSSAAKVDAKSISERKCFLCPANLPKEQEGIDIDNKYQILVNPFPIFPEHFTIPAYDHTDQLILDRYEDMLTLSQLLDRYSLFYNGPKCGASAPDHMHFQAGIKGFMPIEHDVENVGKRELVQLEDLTVYALDNYLRNSFLICSQDKDKSVRFFSELYHALEIRAGEPEPMMNIIAWYGNGMFHTVVLPREQHRPACFFACGGDNILISPASVDLGGVFITPQEKDFEKITAKDIENILKEVCVSDVKFETIIESLMIR
ncbi:DUF4922 domain-containing protein [Dysgonomonas sp. 511]|uniref:DUF4922 domain-containing protein n=1 Tax=Dysgonomonas sp. 511 TaxID=2302930 RepID=UPI0013D39AE2|nr:DUF4922 domain-containing protein [Dysgonomonas sp. 511]NDV78103.1 DUF4922 domain-containing protein [Dysgonomonas sp. 511]